MEKDKPSMEIIAVEKSATCKLEPLNPTKVRKKSINAPGKQLRNQKIISMAINGKSGIEIAAKLGISKETVYRVLDSSDSALELKKLVTQELVGSLDDAVATVQKAVKGDYQAAKDLLNSVGALISQAKLQMDINADSLMDLIRGSYQEKEGKDEK